MYRADLNRPSRRSRRYDASNDDTHIWYRIRHDLLPVIERVGRSDRAHQVAAQSRDRASRAASSGLDRRPAG